MTPQEQADFNAKIAERVQERMRQANQCPDCPGKLEYISSINTGSSNEEGAYNDSLYQCLQCKRILVR